MTNLNNQQLIIVAEYVIKRMGQLAHQADTEAEAITGSIGFVGTSTDSAVSGGSTSSIVERTAASKELGAVRQWEKAKLKLARALQEIDGALTALVPADAADWTPPGSGNCQACERWVSGSAGDRIRAGLCEACRVAVRRMMATDPSLERAAAVARRRSASTQQKVEAT
jgi:hypothetical protein